MTLQADFVQPPVIAAWLLSLFTPIEEAESIMGDLLEEFSHLASKSGTAIAQRWYWRQTAKTVAHLFRTGFRVAPWSTTGAIVGAFLLHGFVSGLPDKVLSAVTDRYPEYWSAHFKTYVFVASDGMLIAHLILSMFVGCLVAMVAKGREMVATMTLSLILCAMIGAAWVLAAHGRMVAAWMLWSIPGPFAIVIGGAIVRTRRSAAKPLPSDV
jgi:hypothetical protein